MKKFIFLTFVVFCTIGTSIVFITSCKQSEVASPILQEEDLKVQMSKISKEFLEGKASIEDVLKIRKKQLEANKIIFNENNFQLQLQGRADNYPWYPTNATIVAVEECHVYFNIQDANFDINSNDPNDRWIYVFWKPNINKVVFSVKHKDVSTCTAPCFYVNSPGFNGITYFSGYRGDYDQFLVLGNSANTITVNHHYYRDNSDVSRVVQDISIATPPITVSRCPALN